MAIEAIVSTKHVRLKLDCSCGTSLEVPVEHLTKVFNGKKSRPTCGANWDSPDEEINPYRALSVAIDRLQHFSGVAISFTVADRD